MAASFLILGKCQDGSRFRPSDWSDRLCGVLTCFDNPSPNKTSSLHYSRYVYPTLKGQEKVVFVDGELATLNPIAYGFLCDFARDNNLVTEALP